MTNQEAQNALANLKRYMSGGGAVDRVTNKAIDIAIEALGAQPEPCEDAVSREAVLDALRTCYDTETITYDNGDEYIHYGDAVGEVEQLPPAQPKQPKKTLYKHFKGGIYELICNDVKHTETGETLVIYRDLRLQIWARPQSEFYGLASAGDELVPRFVLYQQEGDAE